VGRLGWEIKMEGTVAVNEGEALRCLGITKDYRLGYLHRDVRFMWSTSSRLMVRCHID